MTIHTRFSDPVLTWSNNGVPLIATAFVVPTSGKSLRVLWVSVQPNPDNSSSNLVLVKFFQNSESLYAGYVASHWQSFDGNVDQDLQVYLTNAQPVSVTIHYQEI